MWCVEIPYHTHREEKGQALSPFCFPTCGKHLLDNDDIRLQRHVPLWNVAHRLCGCAQKLPSLPSEMFKGSNCKPGKHEPFQRGWSLSLGFLSPFLWAQSGCLQLIICRCIAACNGMSSLIRVLQV